MSEYGQAGAVIEGVKWLVTGRNATVIARLAGDRMRDLEKRDCIRFPPDLAAELRNGEVAGQQW